MFQNERSSNIQSLVELAQCLWKSLSKVQGQGVYAVSLLLYLPLVQGLTLYLNNLNPLNHRKFSNILEEIFSKGSPANECFSLFPYHLFLEKGVTLYLNRRVARMLNLAEYDPVGREQCFRSHQCKFAIISPWLIFEQNGIYFSLSRTV